MIYPNQQTEFTLYNLYTIEIDKGRTCYNCEEFGHLAQNCRRQIMGQEKRVECEDNQNNKQNNLNRKGDLIVLDQILIAITDLQYSVKQWVIYSTTI